MNESEGTPPSAEVARPEHRSAVRDLASHLRLWPVAAVCLAADLWTKKWAFERLDPREGMTIIPHLCSFQRSLNTGALFGLGKGWTPLFIAASVLALVFVLSLFIHSTRDRRSLHVALGLVLAGALGNLYDRTFMIADVVTYTADGQDYRLVGTVLDKGQGTWTIGHWPSGEFWQKVPESWDPELRQGGVVRDFVKMEPRIPIGDGIDVWPWVFNVADVLLVAGVGILLLNFWWDRKAEKAAHRATAGAAQASDAADSSSASSAS